tara:strand:- start:1178 stop:1498 length:321 start_codon:yes stop_codon:yes gene_type:complete
MNKSLLYFAEDATTADSGAIMPADSFLAMELVDANTVILKFKAATNAAGIASVQFDFSGTFKDACRAIAGALNSNTMTVVADEANGKYLSYNGGRFSGVVTVDNVV